MTQVGIESRPVRLTIKAASQRLEIGIKRVRLELRARGARGLSAYELAVSQGFQGSLTDWLDSLQGEDGDTTAADAAAQAAQASAAAAAASAAAAAATAAAIADDLDTLRWVGV